MRISLPPSLSGRLLRGFTLLEALLALLVFSVAVVALVEVVNRMGEAAAEGRRERGIQVRMESLLLEASRMMPLAEETPLTAFSGAKEEKWEEAGVTYLLKSEPLELENADGQALTGLMKMAVIARWDDGAGPQEMDAETWVWPPLFAPDTRP